MKARHVLATTPTATTDAASSENMRLEGKVALITGAAMGVCGEPMGIGGATAWLFAREGAKVALSDLNEDKGRRSADQLRDRGYSAIFVPLDVASEENWIRAVSQTVSAFGRLDILVNGAGNVIAGGIEDSTLEAWDSLMAVHAKGPFLGTKHAVPEMRKVGGGSIVNVSSIDGLHGTSMGAGYPAGKAASRLFSKSAALQYAQENIRVNSIHPGYVETPLSRTIANWPNGPTLEELKARRVSRVPMKREASPEELANAILYLASDDSSYVTGSELVVDGGFSAQ